jgi:hypothetical protein
MILGDMVGAAAESPGSTAAGQGVTYALENRWLYHGAPRPGPRSVCGGNVGVLSRTRRRSIHASRNLSRAPNEKLLSYANKHVDRTLMPMAVIAFSGLGGSSPRPRRLREIAKLAKETLTAPERANLSL